jgi:hypothetical protein
MVATSLLHDAARQPICALGYLQAVVNLPSQTPPQTVPSLRQALRLPCGAPATGVQVPAFP